MMTRTELPPIVGTSGTQRVLGSGVACLAAVAVLSGCATTAEESWNSTAVGDNESIGAVDMRSVLLVSREEGEPGRLLGTLFNNADDPVEVEISDADETVTVTVPADGSVPFDTVETLLQTAGDAPGARTALTASTEAGEIELLVPVVDGTLEPYEPYLPD